MYKMIKGMAISRGIALGSAYVVATDAYSIAPKRSVPESEVASELSRLGYALNIAREQLLDLQKTIQKKINPQAGDLFNAQVMLLKDPVFLNQVTTHIKMQCLNVEAALSEVIEQFSKVMGEIQDVYLRERAADVRDLGRRLLSILIQNQKEEGLPVLEGSIIVAKELLPSSTAQMQIQKISGFITERGGSTSHAAILARSLGTPAITGIPNATSEIKTGDLLIIDGMAGTVFVNPKKSIIQEYERLENAFHSHQDSLKELANLPCRTKDGVTVKLMANIGKMADVEAALLFNADGVGLYRTEFPFLIRTQFPTEGEQYQIMKAAAERLAPRPIVFRTLDLGGDKILPYFPLPPTSNPSLAERGIRLLLKHPDIFKTQLRAILRLSALYPVSILLPMVNSMEEVVQARKILQEAQESLRSEGQPFNSKIALGAMIETPAAVMMVSHLARAVDFFSLGTNDLVQYVLAADRDDPAMASYYEPHHPAVLRLILSSVEAATSKGKEISICGEIAGNSLYTALLLGMGLRSFSVAPGEILEIKEAIRSVSIQAAERLVEKIFELGTAKEIEQCLKKGRANDSTGRTGYRIR